MIFDFEILYASSRKTLPVKSEELNKARFIYNLIPNLMKLLHELDDGTFIPTKFRKRIIPFPKRREVQIPAIRDKIVQNTLFDDYLSEDLSKPLIKETSACIKNRGSDYASKILKEQLRRYYKKHGNNFYALKCDIKSYFASIPHDKIYELTERYIVDPKDRALVNKFVNLLEVGLALGLRQSQILANLNLSGLDHMCKEYLGAKNYGRYMDDFYIISDDYDYLLKCYHIIKEYVESRGLKLNPKTRIFKNKLDFIGFTFYIKPSGKIIKVISKSKKHSKIRHINKQLKMIKNGELEVTKFADSYQGWRAHAKKGNNYNLIKELDQYINDYLNNIGYAMHIKVKYKKKNGIKKRSERVIIYATNN